jgi:hypothetical protein
MSDPTPFLSTIAATSAAMVAIVGGLLVARFVTIASEQEGTEQLLNNAQARLESARRRERTVRDRLHNWDVNDFFKFKMVRAVCDGEQDIQELRDIGGYTPLTDKELTDVVKKIMDEFEVAQRTLRELLSDNPVDGNALEWEDFKRSNPSLPATSWDEIWQIAFDNLLSQERIRHPTHPLAAGFGLAVPPIYIPERPEYVALDIQRRDALRANIERATQQVEDIEDELARLQRARDALVRPKGLGWGLVVLGFFTLVGVIVPIWLMSRGPKRLTAHLGEVVFWLFLAGLLALLGYMSVLALRLSGWRQRRRQEG